MDIIKIRAWDEDELKMISFEDLVFKKQLELMDIFNKHDYIFMLFSGLKDRDGIDIYSGDFLRCEDCQGQETGAIEQVDFKKGAFMCRYRGITLQRLLDSQVVRVVGNVFEGVKND
jgi:hypothetical protein